MISRLSSVFIFVITFVCVPSAQTVPFSDSTTIQREPNDTSTQRNLARAIRDDGGEGAAIGSLICQLNVLNNYHLALEPEMEFQVKKLPNDCTVAYFPNKCVPKGDCPKENDTSDIYWNNYCYIRTPSISMGLWREGGCWVECDKWDKDILMAHNCAWEEKDGKWKIWGTSRRSGTFCPGCTL